jgi:hypothetical protein
MAFVKRSSFVSVIYRYRGCWLLVARCTRVQATTAVPLERSNNIEIQQMRRTFVSTLHTGRLSKTGTILFVAGRIWYSSSRRNETHRSKVKSEQAPHRLLLPLVVDEANQQRCTT